MPETDMPNYYNFLLTFAFLVDIEADNPTDGIYMITDNLSSHKSLETRTWLEAHPRLHHICIPTGARHG
jgi:hypothetical protein